MEDSTVLVIALLVALCSIVADISIYRNRRGIETSPKMRFAMGVGVAIEFVIAGALFVGGWLMPAAALTVSGFVGLICVRKMKPAYLCA